ncbi:MAG: glycosyltransferase [Gammaproteobacteria bacterium]|nr:glycosyltransferase [Gammaproteobacteria bacterium]
MNYKVSVVTPSWNSEKYIEDTLSSVQEQTYPNIEHIIVDNVSMDKTREICGKYDVTFISKKDHSMYEALNTGIQMATGELICFLNSDDLYADKHVIEDVVKFFNDNPNIDFAYGKCVMVDDKLKQIYTHKPIKFNFKSALRRLFVVSHPSTIFKKDLFTKYGLYDTQFRAMSDCDFVLRLCKNESVKHGYIDRNIALFRRHDANLSSSSKIQKEQWTLSKKFGKDFNLIQNRLFIIKDNICNVGYLSFLLKKYVLAWLK